MLLPDLKIPVSIDVFIMNFGYFINEYINSGSKPNLTYKKYDCYYKGYRYSFYYEHEDPRSTSSIRIGEIDVIAISKEEVRITAAVYNFEKMRDALDFFDEFYLMIYENWDIAPYWRLDGFVDSNNVTKETLFRVAQSENIYHLTHNLDYFTPYRTNKAINFAFSIMTDNALSDCEPEFKDIIQKFQLEIRKGLPDISQVTESGIDRRNFEGRESTNEKFKENTQQTSRPWDKIPDKGYDRLMVKLWCEDKTAKEIGDHKAIKRAERTIHDRICKLRNKYPKAKIPYHQEWRNKLENS